ncbi:hypothetical protein V1478_018097 [Vespula squamosa]|uniref:Uncharacterized protein n=1 Tax=Vespula squamosa TaxID=30214 RepID=A0ABD1ZW27_VESSQ
MVFINGFVTVNTANIYEILNRKIVSRSYTIEGEYRPIESKWHYVGRDIRLTSTISYEMSSPIQKRFFI